MFFFLTITYVIIGVSRISGDKISTYIAGALITIIVKTLFAIYFILTIPKLKEYFVFCMKNFANLRIIKPILIFFKYFFGCWIDAFLLLVCVGPKYPKIKVADGIV